MNEIEGIEGFETRIGYHFRKKELLSLALTHSSYNNEQRIKAGNNERLEFLGDAVLELVSSEFLFSQYPQRPEGDLTKLRASLVCEPTLADCAREIDLGSYLRLGKGEDKNGGRKRDSVISDAMEAVIGAIYLDGGYEPAKAYILQFILTDIEHKHLFYDSKTVLQEILQQEYSTDDIAYRLIKETGPEHQKVFHMQLELKGKVLGCGQGRTKKAAEMDAAYQAILTLKGNA